MDCTRNEAGGVENVLIGGENISLEKDVKKNLRGEKRVQGIFSNF